MRETYRSSIEATSSGSWTACSFHSSFDLKMELIIMISSKLFSFNRAELDLTVDIGESRTLHHAMIVLFVKWYVRRTTYMYGVQLTIQFFFFLRYYHFKIFKFKSKYKTDL